MGESTGISWTDATANFWMGCTRVSEACKFCYADRDMTRYGKDFNTLTRAKGIWTDILNPKKYAPGSKVFTCSWSDFFHAGADEWRPEAWDVIRKRPDLTWQILTKRPERIMDHLPPDWGAGWPNVWMGVTAENQKRSDERIPLLLRVPAAVHFVSCEPLLGLIEFRPYTITERPCFVCEIEDSLGQERGAQSHPINCGWRKDNGTARGGIDWVIAGGESGPHARPSHPDWFRSLRDQCKAAGVAFHFKQHGEWAYDLDDCDLMAPQQSDPDDYLRRFEFTDGIKVYRVGTKRAGRLLDGVLWDQMPTTPEQ